MAGISAAKAHPAKFIHDPGRPVAQARDVVLRGLRAALLRSPCESSTTP